MNVVQKNGAAPKQVRGELVDDEAEQIKIRMQQIAWLLDESISLPGTGLSMGIDGLLGLLPGVGDIISAGLSSYIIRLAVTLGVPKVVLARMCMNALIDLLIGAVPVIGDMFDIVWKANRKNVDLVIQHLDDPKSLRNHSWLKVLGLGGVALLIAGSFLWISFAFIAWLFS